MAHGQLSPILRTAILAMNLKFENKAQSPRCDEGMIFEDSSQTLELRKKRGSHKSTWYS